MLCNPGWKVQIDIAGATDLALTFGLYTKTLKNLINQSLNINILKE